MARRLTYLCAVLLALGLSGCNFSICTQKPSTDLQALALALLCFGADYPGVNDAPYATFVPRPQEVDSGGSVSFDATKSYDRDGRIVLYEWDVDGVEGYEIDTGASPRYEAQVFIRGTGNRERRTVGLRVTDDSRETATVTQPVFINRPDTPGPTASFTVTPDPVQARTVAVFDATGSVNASTYEWDFDGDGTFEGLQAPRVEYVYTTEGTRNVTLRVRDTAGVPDTETVPVKVIDARAVAAARRRRVTARLTRVRLPDGLGDLTAVLVRGRLEARGLGPLRRFRRARWAARLNVSVDAATGGTKVRGRAIARFPRGAGRACLRITAKQTGGAPTGRVTLLGGTGDAARLRGGGTFRFGFRGATPRPDGRLSMRIGKARPCLRRTP